MLPPNQITPQHYDTPGPRESYTPAEALELLPAVVAFTQPDSPEAKLAAALELVASLGPESQAALLEYQQAHELPAGMLYAIEQDRLAKEAQAAADLARLQALAKGEEGPAILPPIRPGIIQAPTGPPRLTLAALATLAASVPSSGTNEAYQDKLVVLLGLGPLGQVLAAHLHRYRVAAVAIGGAATIPVSLAAMVYLPSRQELALWEQNLPADLAQRLVELVGPAGAGVPVVATQQPAQRLPLNKAQAKASRKAAGQAAVRRMLFQAHRKDNPYQGPARPTQGEPTTSQASLETCRGGKVPPLASGAGCPGPGLFDAQDAADSVRHAISKVLGTPIIQHPALVKELQGYTWKTPASKATPDAK